MNEWDQRIREHRVWTEMKTLGPAIDDAFKVDGITSDTGPGLERIRAVLAYCGKRLAAAEPIITTPTPLEEIANGLAVARDALIAFASDKNPANVVNANVAADRALLAINQVPGAYSPEELGALVSVATQYRGVVERTLAETQKSLSESNDGFGSLQAKLTELTVNIQAEQQKLTQIVTDQQGQFSAAQETRGKEFTETLRTAQQDLTKLVTDYQGQFSSGQDTRSKEFALALATQQSGYNAVVSDYSKKLADQDAEFTKHRIEFIQASKEDLVKLTSEYEEKAREVLERVQENQRDVEKLVGVIGNLGVTSGYLRTANQAKYGMWTWQTLTVVALITLSGLAYKTLGLLEDSDGHFNWGGFAGRVLLLASLGVIAAYSGSQADKLFVDEKKNRRLALELEAIGPYLAPLPIDEQNKFRIQVGDRSFGQDHDADLRVHRKSPVSIVDLVKSKEGKEFLDLVIEVAKKVNGVK
jgi:hypothetical protein